MKRHNTSLSTSRRAVCLLCAGLALFVGQPAFTDDTDLVRTNTANPYVLVILDTSDSMNLKLGTTEWLPLNGDSPESKIYLAKKAVYESLEDIDDVNFGFMTFNHNQLRVPAKHWLYGLAEPLPAGWPLSYPVVDVNGVVDPTDDVFTLGQSFDTTVPGVTEDPVTKQADAGSCLAPLDLSDPVQRAKANRFPKLNALGNQTTAIWVTDSVLLPSGDAYRLEISAPDIKAGTAIPLPALGDPTLRLAITAEIFKNCVADPSRPVDRVEAAFRFLGEFLMADTGNRFADLSNTASVEDTAGFWGWNDALSTSVCADGSPFSGKGLEHNYDDPAILSPFTPAGFTVQEANALTDDDEFCLGAECRNLKFSPTQVDPIYPEFRELDRGDFIPYHWDISAKDDFLKRFNPKHLSGEAPDYGVASYFADTADPLTRTLPLKNAKQRPILATGPTPFGKAVNDYRCWYLGPITQPAGKCRDKSGDKLAFETGWEEVARTRDADFACRRPYVILISDGEDTCGGENVEADITDFDAQGVQTWILNVGGDQAAQRFKNIIASANADLINVNEGNQLKQELLDIIGLIKSETRAFATAAVPSVQVEADDKILLTSFNPLQGSAIWAGNVFAFLKPLPRKEEPPNSGRLVPDTSTVCNPPTTTNECFLWDAAEVLKTQVDIANPVGPAATQRRIYYPQAPSGSGVPTARGELEGSIASGAGSAVEKDLWQGLGIAFTEGLTPSEEAARIEAKRILDITYALKTGRLDLNDPATEFEFLLGDTFHADPVVLGGPTSNLLFAQNFKDYRDFATKHRFRRKMLLTAANDGMLHFFDVGVAEIVSGEVKFTNGTGKEVAAFVPRPVLPKFKPMADGTAHVWSVDGNPSVADVYLDPTHAGNPVAADREWRTVVVAGLRRGGEVVYGIDITQPDELEEINLTGPPAQKVFVPKTAGTVPDCHDKLGGGGNLACDSELKFPSVLWEFNDSVEIAGQRYRLDEDTPANGEFDLAFTWSKPNIGRIQVDDGGTIVDKFVAVFGGGLDPDKPTTRGDWLYIVDIETGQAIYKKQLKDPADATLSGGAAPSEPAAVDINQDGLLDRIYIGTTGGYLYRVDLGPDSGNLPVLADHNLLVETQPGVFVVKTVPRISGREPRVIFDNLNAATAKRLPLFFRPSVIFTPLLAPNFGLAFGDGDRENLWSKNQSPGRFYVFADDTDPADPTDIITAAQLETVPAGLTGADFLFNPQVGKRHGWVLGLLAGERTVSDAFALSGITVFTTYTPDPDPPPPPGQPGSFQRLCSRTGKSKVFAVMTTNANGVLFDINNIRTRSTGVDTLIGKAFADLSATQNPPSGGGTPPPPDPLPPNRQLIFDELKKLFPSNCRFANYRIDIRAIASDTEIIEVAPVPVCVIEKNWREF